MKIASPNPPYCSCCFNQKPEQTHIDFEAYWDGPIIEGKSFKQPIDDLIVCEDCLAIAAQLVGYVKDEESSEVIKRLRRDNHELEQWKKNAVQRLQRAQKAFEVV